MRAQFKLRSYDVPFASEFETSKGILTHRTGLIVIAESEDGSEGFGEIAPLEGFSNESLESARIAAEASCRRLNSMDVPCVITQLISSLEESAVDDPLPPSVIFGIETAISDLTAKSKGVQLAQFIDSGFTQRVPVNAVITGSADSIQQQFSSEQMTGFTTIKIKVGTYSVKEDIRRVHSVRDLLCDDVRIRLDANRAWDFENALTALSGMRGLGIEYVEEPLQESDLSRFDELCGECAIPIALDETVQSSELFARHVKSNAVTVVVIKPTILGGIAQSREIFEYARKLGKKGVVTSTFETGIGVAACLHLAASFADDILPCGLDTLRYLGDSLIDERLDVSNGWMQLPAAPGLGVTLRPDLTQ